MGLVITNLLTLFPTTSSDSVPKPQNHISDKLKTEGENGGNRVNEEFIKPGKFQDEEEDAL